MPRGAASRLRRQLHRILQLGERGGRAGPKDGVRDDQGRQALRGDRVRVGERIGGSCR